MDYEHPPVVKGWLWPRLVQPAMSTLAAEPCPACGARRECAAASLSRAFGKSVKGCDSIYPHRELKYRVRETTD